MDEASKNAILGVVRSILVVVGSSLTTHGVLMGDQATEIIGPVMTVLPILWGIWDKYQEEHKTKVRENTAMNEGLELVNAPVKVTSEQTQIVLKAAKATESPEQKEGSGI